MDKVQNVLLFFQLLLAVGEIAVMVYAFKTFLAKPRNQLEDRVTVVEAEVKNIKEALLHGNDNFREQKKMNEVFINCMLAFIDFEIAFCQHSGYEHSSDLMRAKTVLQEYLARK